MSQKMAYRVRKLALFNWGIDSKHRGCDLGGLKARDICRSDPGASRAVVMQHKTQRPVQFETTPATLIYRRTKNLPICDAMDFSSPCP